VGGGERAHVSGTGGRQSRQVVAALQRRHQPPAGMTLRQLHRQAGEGGEISVVEPEAAKRILAAGIKAGGDEHELGRERVGRRQDLLPPGRQQLGAGGAGGQGNVHREALAVANAAIGGSAGAGIKRRLVAAAEEHGGIGGENVLGAVAVVYVPIEDQHPRQAMGHLQMAGGNGDVVVDAEAHAALG